MASSMGSSPITPPANLKLSVFFVPPSYPIRSFPLRQSRSGSGAMRVVVGMAAEGGARSRKKYMGTYERERKLAELIERKVKEAKEACEGDDLGSDGCKVAWDEVEEVSQAKAELRRRIMESDTDPLEGFCSENPEADECRLYED